VSRHLAGRRSLDGDGLERAPLAGGSVQTIGSQPPAGQAALSGSGIVFADAIGGNIFSIATTGGITTTLAVNQPEAASPVACGDDICWTTSTESTATVHTVQEGTGRIMRLKQGAAAPTVVAESSLLFGAARAIFDNSNFFVLVDNGIPKVVEVPASGGTPVSLAVGPAFGVDGQCFYWADPSGIFSIAKSSLPESLSGISVSTDASPP
jgi:hypothetical protein